MAVRTISNDRLDTLIRKYQAKGGLILQIREGVLMHGDLLLYSPNNTLKTFVIKEVYQTSWSSVQTIRAYNKCPKKYQKLITY